MRTHLNRSAGRAGFTLLEMVIGVTILAIIARMLIGATAATSRLTTTGNIHALAQQRGEKAMKRILADLRISGEQVVDGRTFPYVFDDGVAAAPFAAYSYAPAPQTALPTEADFGVMRSIVLCRPTDLDGDGRPEIDANADGVPELDGDGDGIPTDSAADTAGLWDPNAADIDPSTRLVWDHVTVAYVVTTGPTGENELVRLEDNGNVASEVVARGVERIQFDTPQSAIANGEILPLGSVRVRIFFRISDSEGHVYRSSNEALVRLRN